MVKVHTQTSAMWRHFNQVRDCVENDNMSAAEQVRFAAFMEEWAASKADNPAFAEMCFAAVTQAQAVRRAHRVRVV